MLTVAVSVSSGVAAITSAFPDLRPYRITLCLCAVGIMTLANLRGLRESGSLFAPPTYLYIISLGSLVVYGLHRVFFGDLGEIPGQEDQLAELTGNVHLMSGASLYLLMRAFSSGAVALTGHRGRVERGARVPPARSHATPLPP